MVGWITFFGGIYPFGCSDFSCLRAFHTDFCSGSNHLTFLPAVYRGSLSCVLSTTVIFFSPFYLKFLKCKHVLDVEYTPPPAKHPAPACQVDLLDVGHSGWGEMDFDCVWIFMCWWPRMLPALSHIRWLFEFLLWNRFVHHGFVLTLGQFWIPGSAPWLRLPVSLPAHNMALDSHSLTSLHVKFLPFALILKTQRDVNVFYSTFLFSFSSSPS